jgi:hypothetical protein
VVANLPWGMNTADYVEENIKILKSLRHRLQNGIPCAFVHKDDKLSSETTMKTLGYEILGHAYIPPLDFDLPKSRKKAANKKTDEDDAEDNGDVSPTTEHQRITVARTILV